MGSTKTEKEIEMLAISLGHRPDRPTERPSLVPVGFFTQHRRAATTALVLLALLVLAAVIIVAALLAIGSVNWR